MLNQKNEKVFADGKSGCFFFLQKNWCRLLQLAYNKACKEYLFYLDKYSEQALKDLKDGLLKK